MSADQPFRDDQNFDKMRAEAAAAQKEVALVKQENELLKREKAHLEKRGIGRSISRTVIVSVAIAAAVYTGNTWFVLLAILGVAHI